jgi:hypothetical protein
VTNTFSGKKPSHYEGKKALKHIWLLAEEKELVFIV